MLHMVTRPAKDTSWQQSVLLYTIGFVLSLAITLVAYLIVRNASLLGWPLFFALALLAITQAVVQLVFFLHIGNEPEPRWKLLVFDFMLLIITILVLGSIWIMNNLDYHGMSPDMIDKNVMEEEGIYR